MHTEVDPRQSGARPADTMQHSLLGNFLYPQHMGKAAQLRGSKKAENNSQQVLIPTVTEGT